MFHVPEKYRVISGPMGSNARLGNNGAFAIPGPNKGRELLVIASDGRGWEHVSVHVEQGDKQRTPYWEEMNFIKDLFWDGDDVVMQLHPRKSEYVNNHPNVLHLWRPLNSVIPTPEPVLVGIR